MMEAAETLRTSPGPSLDTDPYRFLKGVNYLDPDDPIDGPLIGLKVNIDEDRLPTAADQRRLTEGVKNDDLDSVRELVDTHMGIVAAVAYPFAHCGIDAEDLLLEGRHALINAARSYDPDGLDDFSDHAAGIINDLYGGILPDFAADSFIPTQDRPMESIYSFAETLQLADTRPKMAKLEKQTAHRKDRKLQPKEMQVLELLNLPEKDIRDITDISLTIISHRTTAIKRKLGVKTREEAALTAFHKGINFDIPEIPELEEFTVAERLVGMRLGQRNPAIEKELGYTPKQVHLIVGSLLEKTGARSRAELAIMAHKNDFEPSEEERRIPKPSPLEKLTDRQKEAAKLTVGLSDEEAARQLELTTDGLTSLISRAVENAGEDVSNRAELVLWLYKNGMEFDVPEPEKPIHEALYAHEIRIALRSHRPYQEVIDELKLDCTTKDLSTTTHYIRNKVGARSRQELSLMMQMYYHGEEALEVDPDSNGWKLARGLGLTALEGYNLQPLLAETTQRQKELIEAYFLAGRTVTWAEVGKKFGVSAVAAALTAKRGVQRMRKKLGNEPSILYERVAA